MKQKIDNFVGNRNLLLAVVFLTSILTGCTSFEKYDPSPVGVFYPNGRIRGMFPKADFFQNDALITFSQPVRISEVGIMTWNSLTGQKDEVARLESPQLEHLQGDYWIDTEGDYYARTDFLRAHGRIVYTGYETPGTRFWKSFTGFWGTVWGIILVLIVLGFFGIIASLFKSGGGTWSGGGSTSGGGSWSGGGTFKT